MYLVMMSALDLGDIIGLAEYMFWTVMKKK